jgi:glycosyltransferase involved in cell wall biosynthesis
MSVKSAGLCEIRVPTFRRPKLLKRALLSILGQTYPYWRCMVFDDCREGSARSVVEGIQDGRIAYAQNPTRLGAIGNIDKSFFRGPIAGGKYAFILEDDNYLLPDHIDTSIEILAKHSVRVALCNQYCEDVDALEEAGPIGKYHTLNWMYESGCHTPDELLPSLLFSHGFSNGSVFWQTDCLSDFQIGNLTTRPEIQESLRLLRLKDPVCVSLKPTSVWRGREAQSPFSERKLTIATLSRVASNRIDQLMTAKERIDYQGAALKRLGVDRVLHYIATNAIQDFAKHRDDRVASIERAMHLCGYNDNLTGQRHAARLSRLLIGFLARHLYPSQLHGF